MTKSVETSVAQVGLRDFLFYVLPGAVLLFGLLAWKGTTAADLKDYLGVGPSLAGILIAYALGQCAYAVAYPLRALLNSFQSIDKAKPSFRRAYRCAPSTNTVFFTVEVFRYRTMARFCSLMVFPVLFASLGIIFGRWSAAPVERTLVAVFAVIAVAGFLYRYHRYEDRYRTAVEECVAEGLAQ